MERNDHELQLGCHELTIFTSGPQCQRTLTGSKSPADTVIFWCSATPINCYIDVIERRSRLSHDESQCRKSAVRRHFVRQILKGIDYNLIVVHLPMASQIWKPYIPSSPNGDRNFINITPQFCTSLTSYDWNSSSLRRNSFGYGLSWCPVQYRFYDKHVSHRECVMSITYCHG